MTKVEEYAPGKLFIAGEYAVVEPGNPAILVAINRGVTVSLTASDTAGSIFSAQYGQQPLTWHRNGSSLIIGQGQRPFDYLLSAISTVESLVLERGGALRYFHLSISSELDDDEGRKFGLGSSGAVTVAAVKALLRFYGIELKSLEVLKLCLLSSVAVSALSSGGDLAASVYGGWVFYSSPDRNWLSQSKLSISELLTTAWPGLEVEPLSAPASAQLLIGWTGEPASTLSLVGKVQRDSFYSSPGYQQFLETSAQAVLQLKNALLSDDFFAITTNLSAARAALQNLSAATGLAIETPELSELICTAETFGLAAKSSGAGGGDCGIVLAESTWNPAGLFAAWERVGILPLDLKVSPAAKEEL